MSEPSSGPRERSRTPLLDLVTREALDQDYVVRAANRRAAGEEAPPPRRLVAASVIAVFGLLIAMAAAQSSANAEVDNASRAALIDRIETRRADVGDLRANIEALRNGNGNLVDGLLNLNTSLIAAQRDVENLGVTSGFVAATGPGLRVRVVDAPDGTADGRVRASDLRLLVNGLWAAGAEAMAINGRRLTPVTGIVNADIAIQVNKGPVSPPYVVEAIGGPDLAADLADSQSGIAFAALARQFGFEVTRENVGALTLGSASSALRRILYAQRAPTTRPPTEEDPAP